MSAAAGNPPQQRGGWFRGGGGSSGGGGQPPPPPQQGGYMQGGYQQQGRGGQAPPHQQQQQQGRGRGPQQQQQAVVRPPRRVLDAGNLSVTYSGAIPDYIKLIKQLRINPLVFTATGAINPRTRQNWVNFSLRETIFDGSFILHMSRKSLEYRNNLPLPIGGIGSVVMSAEWRLGQPIHKPRLMVALGTDAGAALVRPGSIMWRKAFFPLRRRVANSPMAIGIETAADVSVAMQHDFNDQTGASPAGGFRLNMDVRELNLIVRI